MDISVSELNGRLASKLPPELPLGLVFVVGDVVQLDEDSFVLAEAKHRLNCRLTEPNEVRQGDEIRASGHLMFDSNRLQYYLLTRDIEIVTAEPLGVLDDSARETIIQDEGLLSALAEVKDRAAVSPDARTGDEMPVWVQKLAPSELQGDDGAPNEPAQKAELDEELVALLSAAMDSDEEMELTPELLAPYVPEPAAEVAVEGRADDVELETAASLENLTTSYQPANRQDTDWLVILLIITFLILTIAVVVTVILLLLQ